MAVSAVPSCHLSPQGSSLEFVMRLQEPQPSGFQCYVQGDHALMVGLEHLDQPRKTESKRSGGLEAISIDQRPVLSLDQLTISLIEPSDLTSVFRFDSFSCSLFDLRKESGFSRP